MRADLADVIPVYESLCVDNLRCLVDRHRARPDYPFIDTKFKVLTGEDFASEGETLTIYSRHVIYGWPQGRGMESLAGHVIWLESLGGTEAQALATEARGMLSTLVQSVEALRRRNGGRIAFMMSQDGQPLRVTQDGRLAPLLELPGEAGYSDLFCAKGLVAAARVLGLPALAAEAEAYLVRVIDAIRGGRFRTDQQPLDPRNRSEHIPGRVSHGPTMLALGAVALMLADDGDTAVWQETGNAVIRHILDRYVNHGQFPQLAPWDYVEYLDSHGQPWFEDGRVVCDPGHTLEFVGLTAKVLLRMAESPLHRQCREALPEILLRTFELGFNRDALGICKTVDLASRRPVNDDMPWWSLPETIRAAALTMRLCPDVDHDACGEVLRTCHGAFVEKYVNPAVYSLAYQTRNVRGEPVDVIPGCPDVDPCYHTGLSLIDAMHALAGDPV